MCHILVVTKFRSDDCKEKLPFGGQKPQADPGSRSSWEVPQESKFNGNKMRSPKCILKHMEMRLHDGSTGEELDK